jgi:ribosomal protein S18 acetylase RimI-like enzyme
LSFQLTEEVVAPPLCKRYPFQPSDPAEQANWDHAVVAEDNERLVGFAAAQYAAWNRRAILWHLYVAPNHRGRGVGTRLLDSVEAFAREQGARCLWLETQNVNVPALRFYLRSGFALCGLDTSLYDADGSAREETALFLARPVPFLQ